jgi:hypothetical protein
VEFLGLFHLRVSLSYGASEMRRRRKLSPVVVLPSGGKGCTEMPNSGSIASIRATKPDERRENLLHPTSPLSF